WNLAVYCWIVQQNRRICFRVIKSTEFKIGLFGRTVPNNISSGNHFNISLDNTAISKIELPFKDYKITIHQEFSSGINPQKQCTASSSLQCGIVHLIYNYFHFRILVDVKIKF